MEYVKYDSKQRKELQKNLERLRVEHGLSKQQLADKLGWSRNTLTTGSVGIAYPIEQGSRLYAIISESQTWNS